MRRPEGVSHRAYADDDEIEAIHYQSSIMLRKGEKPRESFPMPATDKCPKCGNVNGNVRREHFFRCYKCCTVVEIIPDAVMPITRKMLQGK